MFQASANAVDADSASGGAFPRRARCIVPEPVAPASTGSHGPRVSLASTLRFLRVTNEGDAERPGRHSHGDRGNELGRDACGSRVRPRPAQRSEPLPPASFAVNSSTFAESLATSSLLARFRLETAF